jgi:hypothetical protein
MSPEALPPPVSDPPPARVKRSLGLILAWIACWHLALFVAPVPGVIAYLLARLCLEDGWANILSTRPGRFLLFLIGLSSAATLAWPIAGQAFFRGHLQRGWIWTGVGLATALLTGLAIATL